MANTWGGYRKPGKPAAVSGPGAHSARTDGGPAKMDLPNAQYGEAKAFQEIQQGAPLAAKPAVGSPGSMASVGAGVTPLDAPTQMPGTPVTDGAAAGLGAGPEALGPTALDPNRADAQYLSRYLPVLIDMASSDNTPPGFKNYVRSVFANS